MQISPDNEKTNRYRTPMQTSDRAIIRVGSVVHLRSTAGIRHYQIVASGTGTQHRHYLPASSPLGKALLGKRSGDTAFVQTDYASFIFEIMSVSV